VLAVVTTPPYTPHRQHVRATRGAARCCASRPHRRGNPAAGGLSSFPVGRPSFPLRSGRTLGRLAVLGETWLPSVGLIISAAAGFICFRVACALRPVCWRATHSGGAIRKFRFRLLVPASLPLRLLGYATRTLPYGDPRSGASGRFARCFQALQGLGGTWSYSPPPIPTPQPPPQHRHPRRSPAVK